MPRLQSSIKKAVNKAVGSSFWIKKTLTSSSITTSAQDLSTAATGRLYVRQVILKSDGGAITGGTNLEIKSNNAKGLLNIAVETFANLTGAVATYVLSPYEGGTNKYQFSVTANPTVLEGGKKLQYDCTGSAGTGAGTIDVFVELVRIDENADLLAA